MPLKMTLEPQEWLMIGTTRVLNIHPTQAKFTVDGSAPILRQVHVIPEDGADTPARKAYLSVQRLYLGLTQDLKPYHSAVEALLAVAPSTKNFVEKASTKVAGGSYYAALRDYRSLIEKLN